MARRLVALVSTALLAATLGACGSDTAQESSSPASPSASKNAGADASQEPVEEGVSSDVTTQPGGGELQVSGDYEKTLALDSTWCLFLNGEFSMFRAPYGPQTDGTFEEPEDGVWLEGFASRLTMSLDAEGTSATSTAGGATVDGNTLTFDAVEVLVSRDGQPDLSATVSGTLECSHIENSEV